MPRLSFDSNVLVYTADRQDHRHARAVEVVARAVLADCVLSVQSVAEFYHVVTRKRMVPAGEAQAQVDDMLGSFPGISYDSAALRDAIIAARHHGLAFWDAMLWATARRAGCRLLISEDGHDGRSLEGVTFVNPFNAANAKLLGLALPPLEPD